MCMPRAPCRRATRPLHLHLKLPASMDPPTAIASLSPPSSCPPCSIPVSPGTTHQLVRQYLLHYGYADTLRAFDAAAGLLEQAGAQGQGQGQQGQQQLDMAGCVGAYDPGVQSFLVCTAAARNVRSRRADSCRCILPTRASWRRAGTRDRPRLSMGIHDSLRHAWHTLEPFSQIH